MEGFPHRIVVIGSSGSGKSTFARACAELGYAHLELDALAHQPNWTALPDDKMRTRIDAFISEHRRWIIDGNYARFRERIWGAADTIVWLDLERSLVVRRLIRRSISRLIRREALWNGNRETWHNFLSLDQERSVLVWAWNHFDEYRTDYSALMHDKRWGQLRWLRLRTRREIDELLARARLDGPLLLASTREA